MALGGSVKGMGHHLPSWLAVKSAKKNCKPFQLLWVLIIWVWADCRLAGSGQMIAVTGPSLR